jgi:hypothetical protein
MPHRSRDEEQQVAAELKRLRETVELREVGDQKERLVDPSQLVQHKMACGDAAA